MPIEREEIRAEWNVAPGEKLIVQIGRLAKSKRNALLLKAVAGLTQRHRRQEWFSSATARSARRSPSMLAESASTAVVIFAGYRRDAAAIMAAADVLAITSNKEGLPIVLLEAMAVGCPIIATAVGAIPQVLSPRERVDRPGR